jgi:hypothetical protein
VDVSLEVAQQPGQLFIGLQTLLSPLALLQNFLRFFLA